MEAVSFASRLTAGSAEGHSTLNVSCSFSYTGHGQHDDGLPITAFTYLT